MENLVDDVTSMPEHEENPTIPEGSNVNHSHLLRNSQPLQINLDNNQGPHIPPLDVNIELDPGVLEYLTRHPDIDYSYHGAGTNNTYADALGFKDQLSEWPFPYTTPSTYLPNLSATPGASQQPTSLAPELSFAPISASETVEATNDGEPSEAEAETLKEASKEASEESSEDRLPPQSHPRAETVPGMTPGWTRCNTCHRRQVSINPHATNLIANAVQIRCDHGADGNIDPIKAAGPHLKAQGGRGKA